MRRTLAWCVLATALSACSSTQSPDSSAARLPLSVGNGIGSQYGNYAMRPGGETQDAEGNRCYVFNWDRPLNGRFAIRYTSSSCESKVHPIWMSATPYVRTVIPIGESNLQAEPKQSDQ